MFLVSHTIAGTHFFALMPSSSSPSPSPISPYPPNPCIGGRLFIRYSPKSGVYSSQGHWTGFQQLLRALFVVFDILILTNYQRVLLTNRPAATAYLPIVSLKNFSRRQSICAMYIYRSGAINGFKTVATTAGRACLWDDACAVYRSAGSIIIKQSSAVELSVP